MMAALDYLLEKGMIEMPTTTTMLINDRKQLLALLTKMDLK